jgi:hypothetical protein
MPPRKKNKPISPQKKNKTAPFPFFILAGGGLFLVIAIFLLANQNPTAVPIPTAEIAPTEDTHPEIQRVSLEEAKTAFDSKSALFLDVRAAGAYQGSRISGAVNIPLGELDARMGELDKAQWIITYCT